MKKLLLTGFEPFLEFTVNPTMRIVEELDGEEIGGYRIIGKILPVDFNASGEKFLKCVRETDPDAVVSLGLAGGRFKVTPERIAINVKDGDPDNEGHRPVDEPIQEGAEPGYLSGLPVRSMVDTLLSAGFPAAVSNTAGTYLCNNIMYEGLHYAATEKPGMPSGFIHIPASHELAIQHGNIPSWSHSDLKQSIVLCLEELGKVKESKSGASGTV